MPPAFQPHYFCSKRPSVRSIHGQVLKCVQFAFLIHEVHGDPARAQAAVVHPQRGVRGVPGRAEGGRAVQHDRGPAAGDQGDAPTDRHLLPEGFVRRIFVFLLTFFVKEIQELRMKYNDIKYNDGG